MRVLKFGGTSVGDAANIRKVVEVIRSRAEAAPILVFSAMGHTTDALTEIGRAASEGRIGEAAATLSSLREFHGALVETLLAGRGSGVWSSCAPLFDQIEAMARGLAVLEDFSPAVQDRLLGFGEILSTRILCEVLRGDGMPVAWVDARDVVVTDDRHTQAEPLFEATAARAVEVLLPLMRSCQIPVTQGFIARSSAGAMTTLGRGGSDFTASLLGAALGAEEIEIWTDVDGIMTADPSLVAGARNIPVMSFQEASELAFFGARVLHPKTLAPAVERGIPVRVLNTARPERPGTVILAAAPPGGGPVKSIAYKEDMVVVNLVSARMFKAQGFLRRVFETLDRHRIAPDLVSTSEVSVALAITPWPGLDALVADLRGLGAVGVLTGQAVVAVVGDGLKRTPGILGQVFKDLDDLRVAMVSEGGSEVAVSFVVGESDLPAVVSRLHRRFFEAEDDRGS